MRTSLVRCGRTFIGSPHPISNIRPALYDFLPQNATAPSSKAPDAEPTPAKLGDASQASPYAVDEFTGTAARDRTPTLPVSKDEWAARWMNVENDRANHFFWLDSNARFNAAKEALIQSYAALPLAPEQTQEDRDVALDIALARFYRGWQDQEEDRQRKYTTEMYRRMWSLIATPFLSLKWVAAFLGR